MYTVDIVNRKKLPKLYNPKVPLHTHLGDSDIKLVNKETRLTVGNKEKARLIIYESESFVAIITDGI